MVAADVDSTNTSQTLDVFNQLGPRGQGKWRVEVTTSRPGVGASFRSGEEIRYFVNSTLDGYLYLFHVHADGSILRIFPNQYQPEARIRAGASIEVPKAGAPFRFQASPPFGLETTVAVVTSGPLDERDFQAVGRGLAKPIAAVPAVVKRGVRVQPSAQDPGTEATSAGKNSGSRAPSIVWNSITVLVHP
jgi:Domain of unknown function (DUF4384)